DSQHDIPNNNVDEGIVEKSGQSDIITKDDVTLVAFNGNSFDFFVLSRELASLGMKLPSSVKYTFDPITFLSRKYQNCAKSTKLCDIYEYIFNEKLNNSHDALSDCSALLDILFFSENGDHHCNLLNNLEFYSKW